MGFFVIWCFSIGVPSFFYLAPGSRIVFVSCSLCLATELPQHHFRSSGAYCDGPPIPASWMVWRRCAKRRVLSLYRRPTEQPAPRSFFPRRLALCPPLEGGSAPLLLFNYAFLNPCLFS